MSLEGIKLFANVLSGMQSTRIRLIGLKNKKGENDNQNIRLGQILLKAKEAIKWDFTKETLRKD